MPKLAGAGGAPMLRGQRGAKIGAAVGVEFNPRRGAGLAAPGYRQRGHVTVEQHNHGAGIGQGPRRVMRQIGERRPKGAAVRIARGRVGLGRIKKAHWRIAGRGLEAGEGGGDLGPAIVNQVCGIAPASRRRAAWRVVNWWVVPA